MKKYVVTGTRPYKGHKLGEAFEAELTEAQEARAIGRHSIRLVNQKKTAEEIKAESETDSGSESKE
jgi:hypothetical protein